MARFDQMISGMLGDWSGMGGFDPRRPPSGPVPVTETVTSAMLQAAIDAAEAASTPESPQFVRVTAGDYELENVDLKCPLVVSGPTTFRYKVQASEAGAVPMFNIDADACPNVGVYGNGLLTIDGQKQSQPTPLYTQNWAGWHRGTLFQTRGALPVSLTFRGTRVRNVPWGVFYLRDERDTFIGGRGSTRHMELIEITDNEFDDIGTTILETYNPYDRIDVSGTDIHFRGRFVFSGNRCDRVGTTNGPRNGAMVDHGDGTIAGAFRELVVEGNTFRGCARYPFKYGHFNTLHARRNVSEGSKWGAFEFQSAPLHATAYRLPGVISIEECHHSGFDNSYFVQLKGSADVPGLLHTVSPQVRIRGGTLRFRNRRGQVHRGGPITGHDAIALTGNAAVEELVVEGVVARGVYRGFVNAACNEVARCERRLIRIVDCQVEHQGPPELETRSALFTAAGGGARWRLVEVVGSTSRATQSGIHLAPDSLDRLVVQGSRLESPNSEYAINRDRGPWTRLPRIEVSDTYLDGYVNLPASRAAPTVAMKPTVWRGNRHRTDAQRNASP